MADAACDATVCQLLLRAAREEERRERQCDGDRCCYAGRSKSVDALPLSPSECAVTTKTYHAAGSEELKADIAKLHQGLAKTYNCWEVSREYAANLAEAMQILTEVTGNLQRWRPCVWLSARNKTNTVSDAVGRTLTVQEPRFSFFDIPGMACVPRLLEMVEDECSSECSSFVAGSHGQGCASSGNRAAETAYMKAVRILDMLDEHFEPSFKIAAPSAELSVGWAQASVKAGGAGGGFTMAEDALLLIGLKRFGFKDAAWDKIREKVLPTKRAADIRARFKACVSRYVSCPNAYK